MTQIPKNPFDREDWFSEVVKSNDSIMNSSKKAFLQFQTKYNPQSMTKFQKVLTFFTTHTITAVVTASICLGGIATFAAQTVAPEQYKPSTVVGNLFKNNKIQQTNPNTPLVSDAQNDVVSYDPCNISIKYPKFIDNKTIIATLPADFVDGTNNQNKRDVGYYGVTIMDKESRNYDTTKPQEILNLITISCWTSPLDQNELTYPQVMTKNELSELTGWFISGENNIKNIRSQDDMVNGPFKSIYFEFGDKYYNINFTTKKINPNALLKSEQQSKEYWMKETNKPGIFGDQVQIQFNNVANNVPNAEILKFDNVATSGFLFEYDKKLELNNKEKFEFLDPSKDNNLYVIKDKTLQDKITQLGLNNGDSIIFSGQVTNSNGKINVTKQEEFTITKIDKVVRSISEVEKSKLDTMAGDNIKINEKIKFQAQRGYEGGVFYDFEREDKSIIRIGAFNLSTQNINPVVARQYNFSGEIKKEEWFNNPEIQKTYNQMYNYPLNQVVWSPSTTKGFLFDNVEIKDVQTPKTQKVESAEVSYIDNGDGAILSIDGLRNGYFVDEKIKNQLSIAFDQPEGTKFLFSGDVIKTGNGNFLVDKITSFIIFGGGGPRIITNDSPVGVPDYNTIPARTGAAVPTKIIKDIEIRAGGVGLYQSYSDIYSNEEYIIKDEYVPGSDKMSEATAIWNMKLVEKNPNLRYGGGGGTYTFAGEVLDFGNNQYEIIKINKFEFKSIE